VAVTQALRMGALSFDVVKHLLLCRVERRPPRLDLDCYPYQSRSHRCGELRSWPGSSHKKRSSGPRCRDRRGRGRTSGVTCSLVCVR
ncbi:hypothetical protein D2T30_22220, partial [Sinirhodobacter populi]